jgi:hypothetical protein
LGILWLKVRDSNLLGTGSNTWVIPTDCKINYSHSLSYKNVSTEYLEASAKENGEMVAGHLQCWVEGLLDPEAAVILTEPLSILESGPWSQGWCLRSVATWWVAVDLGTWTQSFVTVRWLHPSPQHCLEFLPANPCLADWGGWGYYRVLLEFLLEQSTAVKWPHNCLLGHGLPLSLSGSSEAWTKLCNLSFNPVLLSASNKSLNFHESHTLPDSLEIWIHMCTWLAS